MRIFKVLVICGVILFLAAIFAAGYILFIRPATLPVYHMAQHMSEHGNIMATTLMRGDISYISDDTEMPLELTAAWVGKNNMVGRTDDGMEVYAIPQQDPRNYLMLTTEMFPQMVFRNASLPPVQLSTWKVDEIQVLESLFAGAPAHKTRDQAVIRDVVDGLLQRKGAVQGAQPPRSAFVRLVSDQLPGLAYAAYAYADPGGSVYLAARQAEDAWIPAGPAFTGWFISLPLRQ